MLQVPGSFHMLCLIIRVTLCSAGQETGVDPGYGGLLRASKPTVAVPELCERLRALGAPSTWHGPRQAAVFLFTKAMRSGVVLAWGTGAPL